jgi:predicted RNA polymerase sigma factor
MKLKKDSKAWSDRFQAEQLVKSCAWNELLYPLLNKFQETPIVSLDTALIAAREQGARDRCKQIIDRIERLSREFQDVEVIQD